MTTERLQRILNLILEVDRDTKLQQSLARIAENLTTLSSSPAAIQYQESLANALEELREGAAKLTTLIRPGEAEAIAEIGGAKFFSPSIYDDVREAVERNAMTPSVARDFVQHLVAERSEFLGASRTTVTGLIELLFAESVPMIRAEDGEAAFTIPREIFGNHLGSFAKELQFISQLVQYLNEAVSGTVQEIELTSLSTSTPTVAITTGLDVLLKLGTVIATFLAAWERIQKMRSLREEVKELNASATAVQEFDDKIISTVEEVVEESVRFSLSGYTKKDGRENELRNALSRDFHRLYGQIERGLTVDIRTGEAAGDEGDEATSENRKELENIVQKMRFPGASAHPQLLTAGELLEGDISLKKSKTTKTTKTTTNKTTKTTTKQNPKKSV